jgi:hypothetical protein
MAPFPRALRDDMDELRAQAEVLRSQIDVEGIRESVRAQIGAMAPRIAAQAGAFAIDRAFALAPQKVLRGRHDSDDRAYERGQRALDRRNWDEALESFTQVAGSGGSRADGALYWKAYTLAKLGRRDDALAAIAELRKSYATSRWLDEAKALELEVKQASGQKPSPEAENDEELKLMALNGLVQSDPERALPLLTNLLKTSSSPKLKERALFVLAQSNSPQGKQLLEQSGARQAGNPDLQLKAISYIAATSKENRQPAAAVEIYSSSNDNQVKRAALSGHNLARQGPPAADRQDRQVPATADGRYLDVGRKRREGRAVANLSERDVGRCEAAASALADSEQCERPAAGGRQDREGPQAAARRDSGAGLDERD